MANQVHVTVIVETVFSDFHVARGRRIRDKGGTYELRISTGAAGVEEQPFLQVNPCRQDQDTAYVSVVVAVVTRVGLYMICGECRIFFWFPSFVQLCH